MIRYILKRLGMSVVVVALAMVFLGVLVHLVPGDPVKIILGPRASDALSEIVREQMQLDEPVPVQVGNFLFNAFQGDLGEDFVSRVPVTELIWAALPHTLILAVTSLALAAIVGIPLGVFAATHPNSWIDRITGVIGVSMITLPAFVAGLFLLLIFAVKLEWLPAIGSGSFSDPVDYIRHLILPATALAVTWVGYLARLVRASMMEVLGSPYIRTAQAYGIQPRLISYKYALKNAVIPTVAVLGVGLGNLVGNAVFVEVIFTRPGLGTLLVQSIETRNFPIVRGAVLVVAVMVVLANLLADLSYRMLDPRIRVGMRDS
ncbi:MAG: peptide/nickel transport system permease protein [Gaiellales bacterium]|nr:peptide/nickel transport system permease protein [Gaiellales bacterium]